MVVQSSTGRENEGAQVPSPPQTKQFKDPIYGYIEIDSDFVTDIIDTAAFQRLKDIRQTSYAPLYPSAYHNRFVHSLGVYHLGRMAFQAIKPQLIEESKDTEFAGEVENIQRIFELACLLHDVGHAPFSHTGETFFLDKTGTLYAVLKECVEDTDFINDFDALGTKKPAPHECMSCVVGIRVFYQYFTSSRNKSFFARCITGIPIQIRGKTPEGKAAVGMSENTKQQRKDYKRKKRGIELLNCVISLLNSSIIDVDRLDYIIRDAATIGFKNVQVDYIRLLKGMRILRYESTLRIGYHKSALSVIESAVYAHDAEKKWIQGHPSILYEMEALKHAMSQVTSKFIKENDDNPLFCFESLTEEGKTLTIAQPLFSDDAQRLTESDGIWSKRADDLHKNNMLFNPDLRIDLSTLSIITEYPISLLADEDFLYLMKLFCKNDFGYEYFSRNKRRSAVWKSEAEFRALFQTRIGDDTEYIKQLENQLKALVQYCQDNLGIPIVDKQIFSALRKEREEAEKEKENGGIDADDYQDIISGLEEKERWATMLEQVAKELEIPFEFLIIFQKKFIGDIPILFPSIREQIVPLKNIVDVLTAESNRKSNFFHLFYRTDIQISESKKKEIVNALAQALISGVTNTSGVS